MTEMALRSRIAVLVVATLLSIAGTFGTSAFLATQEAQAGTILIPNGPTPNPFVCVKTTTYPYYYCHI